MFVLLLLGAGMVAVAALGAGGRLYCGRTVSQTTTDDDSGSWLSTDQLAKYVLAVIAALENPPLVDSFVRMDPRDQAVHGAVEILRRLPTQADIRRVGEAVRLQPEWLRRFDISLLSYAVDKATSLRTRP